MANSPEPATNAERLAVLRIVDANFNRASEGLRVVEEYFRFAVSDGFLARQCKELRHDLTQTLAAIPAGELAQARDTQRDVGASISTEAEQRRESLADVVAANWKRVEQALRVLEEYGKGALLDAVRLEQLRYRAYTLGKAILTRQSSRDRLANARLYVLIDGGGAPGQFDESAYRRRVRSLIEAGVHVLQLREKTLDDATLLARARVVRKLAAGSRTLFIMNDRADLAVAAGADGVHLGQEDLPVYEARRIVGTESLIGVSTHTIEQARQVVLDGADYLGCGPTFLSSTKQFDQLAGLEFLRQIAAEITLPAFAIGGITAENLPQVLETGVFRVAISGAVWGVDNSAEMAREIARTMAAVLASKAVPT